MTFSPFLASRREAAKTLTALLREQFSYVSILGADIKARSIVADKNTTGIYPDDDTECGFVVKTVRDGIFFEYSLDDIAGDARELAETIASAFRISAALKAPRITPVELTDEPLVQSFSRETDLDSYTEAQLLDFCIRQRNAVLASSEDYLNAVTVVGSLEVSKLFISENRELDQHYSWINGTLVGIDREGDKVIQVRE